MVSSISLSFILPLLVATYSRAADHRVVVGGPNLLMYTPETVRAAVGDTITFEFHEKNHTVTQAAFESPCSPLSGGFDSDFMPVAAGTSDGFPTYTIQVKDDKPLWAYCKQKNTSSHCQAGMVFAANAPYTGNTFEAFKEKAMASGGNATTSTTYNAQPSATGTGKDHKVIVGGPNLLRYTPDNIQTAVGDTITFEFHEKNHTVTQAAFESPCSPLRGGFDSGFMPVSAGAQSGFPTYTIQVKDNKPIWAYCKQKNPSSHCQAGMVFAANAPYTGNTFEAFREKAMASGGNATSTSEGSYTSSSGSYSHSSATATSTSSAWPTTHTVVVGGSAGLVFTPPTVDAKPGDAVVFQFMVKNHTVTQSSFSNPCTKLETSSYGAMKGFDSGFMPVAPDAKTLPTFKVIVNDSAPIWGYCRQDGHCVSGMVFGINAPKSGPNTFAAFQQLAIHSNVTAL